MNELTFTDVIQAIQRILKCSQSRVAKMLEFAPNTPSNNKDKLLSELTPKTKDKLLSLYAVIRPYAIQGLQEEVISYILETQVFEDHNGNKDSVLTSLRQDKYALETLANIAEMAYSKFQKRQERSLQPLEARSA
jgi:ferritin-like protein